MTRLSSSARATRSKGDFVRAVTDYSTALAFNPDDTTLYNSRALTHVSRGDYIAAIADATKAATLGLTTPATTKPITAKRTATKPAAAKPAAIKVAAPNKPQPATLRKRNTKTGER